MVTKQSTGARPSFHLSPGAIPDRVIGVFFAAFLIAAVGFLSVQAVRANGIEAGPAMPGQQKVQAAGR